MVVRKKERIVDQKHIIDNGSSNRRRGWLEQRASKMYF